MTLRPNGESPQSRWGTPSSVCLCLIAQPPQAPHSGGNGEGSESGDNRPEFGVHSRVQIAQNRSIKIVNKSSVVYGQPFISPFFVLSPIVESVLSGEVNRHLVLGVVVPRCPVSVNCRNTFAIG